MQSMKTSFSAHVPTISDGKRVTATAEPTLPGQHIALPPLKHQIARHAKRRKSSWSPKSVVHHPGSHDVGRSPLERAPEPAKFGIAEHTHVALTVYSASGTLREPARIDQAVFDLISRRVDMLLTPLWPSDAPSVLEEVAELLGAPPDARGRGASGALAIRSTALRRAAVDKVLELFKKILSKAQFEAIEPLTLGEDEAACATKLYRQIADACVWRVERNDLGGHDRDDDGRGSGIKGLPGRAQRAEVYATLHSVPMYEVHGWAPLHKETVPEINPYRWVFDAHASEPEPSDRA